MSAMREGSTPYDPKDPYWVFKEAAAFEHEFQQKVELPMLAAMAERVDRMWDEAIAKSTPPTRATDAVRRT